MMQELTQDGKLVRSWNSEDHIGLDETPDFWWDYLTLARRDLRRLPLERGRRSSASSCTSPIATSMPSTR